MVFFDNPFKKSEVFDLKKDKFFVVTEAQFFKFGLELLVYNKGSLIDIPKTRY